LRLMGKAAIVIGNFRGVGGAICLRLALETISKVKILIESVKHAALQLKDLEWQNSKKEKGT